MTKLIVPKSLSLYPFQVKTIEKSLAFLKTRNSVYCANEQGLGKSITTIVTLNTLNAESVLIICPAVMRLVWEEEIRKWSRDSISSIENILVVEKSSDLTKQACIQNRFVICSYALLANQKNVELLSTTGFDFLVLDEAQAVKNPSAKRTKAVAKSLFPNIPQKIFLSGTPMTRNVIDLYVPFHLIAPDKFPSFPSFACTYSKKRKH